MAGDLGRIPLQGDHSLIRPTPESPWAHDAHTGLSIPPEYVVKNPRGPGYRDSRYIRYWLPVYPIPDAVPFYEDEVSTLLD